ncbi:hypothetical protein BABINDRAFT_146582 [Babjeviella inositovora NRRL Y-12698]|uniref:Uncharacterized protein n=1 Tax=Babjeviella inositovora NRRL Y-12698 TaxID=984486 RepID=A0A1E3QPK9_9ASCO|nr:uncharacterized protein BABINDRAFT_146582 [Babjeviella inositovora NRRL Y-12698]ODQ79002.1 hypothetical protein BABINDRAFT_146582 [Babjeviella inositovora NRRL Y-12698]
MPTQLTIPAENSLVLIRTEGNSCSEPIRYALNLAKHMWQTGSQTEILYVSTTGSNDLINIAICEESDFVDQIRVTKLFKLEDIVSLVDELDAAPRIGKHVLIVENISQLIFSSHSVAGAKVYNKTQGLSREVSRAMLKLRMLHYAYKVLLDCETNSVEDANHNLHFLSYFCDEVITC